MKCVIVYYSRFGNGKKLVEHLACTLQKNGETQVCKCDEANPTAMLPADVYVFSAAAEALSINRDMKKFMKNLEGMDGKKYGIINTYGMKKNRLDKMEKILSKKKMVKVADVAFHVEGPDVQKGNGLPEHWEEKIDEFATKLNQI
jgi:flavodoxin